VVTDAGVEPRPPIARYAIEEPTVPPPLQLFGQDRP